MSETESPDTPKQTYLPVNRLQRYVISMMLLSVSIGLNIGMFVGNPSKLMLAVTGLGASLSGLFMLYTGSHYAEIDAAVSGKDDEEPAFWYRLLHGG